MALCLLAAPALASGATRTWAGGQSLFGPVAGFGSGGQLSGIACPDATHCSGVDGAGNAISFNPESSGAGTSTDIFDSPGASALTAVACSTAAQCTAVSGDGFEVTYDPQGLAAARAVQLDSDTDIGSVACPTASECVAVGSSHEIEFDPQAPGNAVTDVIDYQNSIEQVSCPGSTECVSIDQTGSVEIFNPTSPGSPTSFSEVPAGADRISCLSSGECTAVSPGGTFEQFQALNPGAGTGSTINATGVSAISCVASTQCVVVTSSGSEQNFDPRSVAASQPVNLGSEDFSAVVCVSAGQCTATDTAGGELTFNPASPSTATRELIDTNLQTGVLACPALGECSLVDGGGAQITFDPTTSGDEDLAEAVTIHDTPIALSCPSTTQCTVIDVNGDETTYDPEGGAAPPTPVLIDPHTDALTGISCPIVTQCTASSYSGFVTFNPQNPGTPALVDTSDFGIAVACPSATQCTLMSNAGDAYTFNPQSPGSPAGAQIDANGDTPAIACPSLTECVTVDAFGNETAFNPQAPGAPTPQAIDTVSYTDVEPSGTDGLGTVTEGASLASVDCPTVTDCVATDVSGNVLEGNPTTDAAWTSVHPAGTGGLKAVSCPDPSVCMVIDDSGDVSAGGLAPTNTVAPSIPGAAVVTAVSGVSVGVWSTAPLSYSYQWFDCDPGGQNCSSIAGATSSEYAVSSADVGHTLVVQETAHNYGGTSSPAASAPTAVVPAPNSAVMTTTTTAPSTGTTGKAKVTTPSAKEIAAIRLALHRLVTSLTGKRALLGAISTRRGFSYSFAAPANGMLKLTWTTLVKRRTVTIASVSQRLVKGRRTVVITLTKAGRTLVAEKRLATLRIRVSAAFTPVGIRRFAATGGVELKRR